MAKMTSKRYLMSMTSPMAIRTFRIVQYESPKPIMEIDHNDYFRKYQFFTYVT